jgi:hypothetical protein
MEQRLSSGFVPNLNNQEMVVLSAIVDQIQLQILKNSDTLTLTYDDTPSWIDGAIYHRVLEHLGGLRFVTKDQDEYRTRLFFDSETRLCNPESQTEISLTLDAVTEELMLGYVNPHKNLLRHTQAGSAQVREVSDVLADLSPLCLDKTIWSGLSPLECMLWTRMEQATQWEYKMIDEGGSCSYNLDRLFNGVDPKTIDLERKLRIVTRLAELLHSQEYINPLSAGHFLGINLDASKEFQVSFAWTNGHSTFQSKALHQYRNLVSDFYFTSLEVDELRAMALFLTGGKMKQVASALSLHQQLANIREPMIPVLMLNTNMPICAKALFWEWSLRRQSWPLPDGVQKINQIVLDDQQPIESRFNDFCKGIREDSDFQSMIESQAPLTIFSEATQSSIEFQEFVAASRVERLQPTKADEGLFERAKPEVQSQFPEHPVEESPNPSAPLSKMLAIAEEELARMRSQFPNRYKELKMTYFSSLSESEREMVVQIRGLMQVQLFEDHLQKRLIKFMVENPAN